MFLKAGRFLVLLGAMAPFLLLAPYCGPAHAQGWGDGHHGRWERERERDRAEFHRRERERNRREEARNDRVVAGVVGTVLVAGIIAAAANRDKEERERGRADYCLGRYGNYDRATDTYRASNGYSYRCQ
jgi:hypothetical protein